jgi:hypothetical protein
VIFLGDKDLLIEQNKDNTRKNDEAKITEMVCYGTII